MNKINLSKLKRVAFKTAGEIQNSLQKPGKRKKKKPAKSKLQVKKDNPNSKYWKEKALTAWGEYAHRTKKHCAICGRHESETKLDAHHLIGKAKILFRNDIDNMLMLCVPHHLTDTALSAHTGQIGFTEWLKENMPDKYDYIITNRYRQGKPNYREEYENLKELNANN